MRTVTLRSAPGSRAGRGLLGLLLVGSLTAVRVARADDAAPGTPDGAGSSTPDDASASSATAPVDAGKSRRPWLTARLALGVGSSNMGVSAKYSLSAEGWFYDYVGIGAFGGASGQSTLGLLGPADNENDEGIGLALAFRSSPGPHYVLFSIGGGLAHGHQWQSASVSLDGSSPVVPAPVDHDGTSFDLVLGWLADMHGAELGVLANLDMMSWGTTTFTVNLAFGFGAR